MTWRNPRVWSSLSRAAPRRQPPPTWSTSNSNTLSLSRFIHRTIYRVFRDYFTLPVRSIKKVLPAVAQSLFYKESSTSCFTVPVQSLNQNEEYIYLHIYILYIVSLAILFFLMPNLQLHSKSGCVQCRISCRKFRG